MAESTSIELKPEERTECEVWSRVMGYHRPVSAYNQGKRQEHRDRRFFREGAQPDLMCRKLCGGGAGRLISEAA